MKLNIKRKSGSALLMVLALGTVVIIAATALSSSIVKSREYNERFNKADDLELAAKSGIDIAKDYLINKIEDEKIKIKSVKDIDYSLPSGYIDNIIQNKDGINYDVKITKDKLSTELIGIFNILSKASKSNVIIEKEEVVKVKISSDNDLEEDITGELPPDIDLTYKNALTQQSYDVSHLPNGSNESMWRNRDNVFKKSYNDIKYVQATHAKNKGEFVKEEIYDDGSKAQVSKVTFSKSGNYGMDYKEAKKMWGYIKVPKSGNYRFAIWSDDGVKLQLNVNNEKKVLVENFYPKGINTGNSIANENLSLDENVYYPIYIEYFNWGGGAALEFKYQYLNSNGQVVDDDGIRIGGNLNSSETFRYTTTSGKNEGNIEFYPSKSLLSPE